MAACARHHTTEGARSGTTQTPVELNRPCLRALRFLSGHHFPRLENGGKVQTAIVHGVPLSPQAEALSTWPSAQNELTTRGPGEPLAFSDQPRGPGHTRLSVPVREGLSRHLHGLTQRLSLPEMGREHFGYLVLTEDPNTFMLAFSPKDEENMGLSFYGRHPHKLTPHPGLPLGPPTPGAGALAPPALPGPPSGPSGILTSSLLLPAADKPEVTQEQMGQFQETIKCMGMNTSEIMYTDEKKVSAGRPGQCPPEGAPHSGNPRGPERESCQPGLHSKAGDSAFQHLPHRKDS